MGLETGSTIASLITSNPTSGDPVSQGDDHIKLLKSVLQAQFPGTAAAGFAIPITATEAELNLLHTNGFFKSNTTVPFYMLNPPVGWTATNPQNDSMMRVVTSGTTGGASGAGAGHSPILNNVVASHTHTFTSGAMNSNAAHTHTDAGHAHSDDIITSGSLSGAGSNPTPYYNPGSITGYAYAAIQAANIDHTHSGTTAGNAATNWRPRYLDFCIGYIP